MKALRSKAAVDLEKPELLGTEDERVLRMHAGDTTFEEFVNAAVHDPSEHVAWVAIWKLGQRGGPPSTEVLKRLRESGRTPFLRECSARRLRERGAELELSDQETRKP